MNNMSKISVIVPIYNMEKYLFQSIESIRNQTFSDIEIILVDDGSNDRSAEICDQLADIDGRIRVIHKKNGGVSSARNEGLLIASGDFVIFPDPDDYLPSDALAKLYRNAVENDADIVIGDLVRFTNDGDETRDYLFNKMLEFSTVDEIERLICTALYYRFCPFPGDRFAQAGYGAPGNKIIKRKLLADNKIKYDPNLRGVCDDFIFSLNSYKKKKKIEYINDVVYYYRIIPESITHSYNPNKLVINEEIYNSLDRLEKKISNHMLYQNAFAAYIIRIFSGDLHGYFFKNHPMRKSNKEIRRELKETIISDRLQWASNNLDDKYVSSFHKIISFFIRRKLVICIELFTKLLIFRGRW